MSNFQHEKVVGDGLWWIVLNQSLVMKIVLLAGDIGTPTTIHHPPPLQKITRSENHLGQCGRVPEFGMAVVHSCARARARRVSNLGHSRARARGAHR